MLYLCGTVVLSNPFYGTVTIYYIGPGKKDTGDWCFNDGFITFKDIADAYLECFQSKRLAVASDCSYSGRWVRKLAYFLDDVGVQPCGHSAKEQSILLKVNASCKSHQVPHALLYSARGRGNDAETGVLYAKLQGYEVEQGQHVARINSTRITCKKGASFVDPCLIASDFTWDKRRENERIQLVQGEHQGRKGWWYVFLHDVEEMEEQFDAKRRNGTLNHINLSYFGCVFKSGWGETPPEKLQRAIRRRCDNTKHTYY